MRVKIFLLCSTLLVLCTLPQSGTAQTPDDSGITEDLPSAPQPQTVRRITAAPVEANLRFVVSAQNANDSYTLSSTVPQNGQAVPTPNAPMRLTRVQAEQLALKNNPQISVGHLLGLAQHQVYRQARAAELPTFNGAITAVDANEGSRIGAGSLNAPRLLEHAGAGVTLTQLLEQYLRPLQEH